MIPTIAVRRDLVDLACRRLFGGPLVRAIVDTQAVALRTFQRRQMVFKGSTSPARLQVGPNLPRYAAHNALSDALAAAELFLAQPPIGTRARVSPAGIPGLGWLSSDRRTRFGAWVLGSGLPVS